MPDSAKGRAVPIETLVAEVERISAPRSRKAALSPMEAILGFHGEGLERMVEIVLDGEAGKAAVRRLADDPLVSGHLVLHTLHPDDIGTRVQRALTKMSGSAELIGVFEGSVRIRLTGSACGHRDSVEAALREAVPDAAEIVIEETAPVFGFVPLKSITVPLEVG